MFSKLLGVNQRKKKLDWQKNLYNLEKQGLFLIRNTRYLPKQQEIKRKNLPLIF